MLSTIQQPIRQSIRDFYWRDHIVLIAIFVITGIFAVTSPHFLTVNNLVNVIRQTAIVAVLGVGMTFAIISAEIDISIGGIAAISGMLAAVTMATGLPWPLGLAVGIGTGVLFGLLNGVISVRVGIPSFLVTLGMLGVTSGLALIVTATQPVRVTSDGFLMLFSGWVGPVPVIVIWAAIVAVVGHIVLKETEFGRHVYATGDDTEAARYTGINTAKVRLATLTICGGTAGFAGMLLIARLSVARPTMGDPLMLPAIAAVILGGTSLFGGRGTIWGTLLGAFLMSLIDNGLVLHGFGSSHQELIRGAVIIAAVALREQEGEGGWI